MNGNNATIGRHPSHRPAARYWRRLLPVARLGTIRLPIREWRFWGIQLLIVLIAVADRTVDVFPQGPPLLSFLTVTLFLLPVTYSALALGFSSSVATALWCVAVDGPLILVYHRGPAQLTELTQLVAISAIAVFVGHRVDRESSARRQADAAQTALLESEARYRTLFETSPIPILLVEPNGIVREMNSAATVLFETPAGDRRPDRLADLVGAVSAGALGALIRHYPNPGEPSSLEIAVREDTKLWMEPHVTRVADSQRGSLYQVLLHDVTEAQHRQENLKVFAEGVLRAHEEERRRLAQELHDETIQTLILLCRQLDVDNSSELMPPAVAAGLRDARASAESLVQALREFAHTLRPSVLDDLGLVASVRQLVGQVQQRSGAAGRFRVKGRARRLSAHVELGIFRIAQEAIRNIERHAEAGQFLVRLAFGKDEVRLTVSDDGRGFEVSGEKELLTRRRLGLVGMRERAQLLGGALYVRAGPGKGTTLSVRVPSGDGQPG